MVYQVLTLKILWKFFQVVLSSWVLKFIRAWFFIILGSLQRWCSCSICVCLCYTLGEFFFHENPPKNKWSNCCLLRVREVFFFFLNFLLEREGWKFLKNAQSWKFSSLPTFSSTWQVKLFLTDLFQKLYPPLGVTSPRNFIQQI